MNLLIANRGEIAVRIARAAAELGMRTIAVYSQDDADSLHIRKAEHAVALPGAGPRAYLDGSAIIAAALESGCDAIHPGYGFLSESGAFARDCAEAGLRFVGPTVDHLELFGDKGRARSLAQRLGVPVLRGTFSATTLEDARFFLTSLGARGQMIIKASAGGGGRGMRFVADDADLNDAYARCQSEAAAAFGRGDVYVEEFFPRARHIEIQVIGDGSAVTHLWERECSLQRRHQKVVEIAPSPTLPDSTRQQLIAAALQMAREIGYESVGTFEFLVDARAGERFAFIEANARLQVEHTVTEEVLGIDLVQAQLRLAAGATLSEIGLEQRSIPRPRGYAMQLRVNMESMQRDGSTRPTSGTLNAFEPPAGPGVRVDSFGYTGYRTSSSFDPLLAKVIAHSSSDNFTDVVQRAYRALCEFRIEGVATNVGFLQNLLCHPSVESNEIDTTFIERHASELAASDSGHPRLYAQPSKTALAGARIDTSDPLAVLHHGKQARGASNRADVAVGLRTDGAVLKAPMQGTIVSVDVNAGDVVRKGQQVAVMESMKMEHVIEAAQSGQVLEIMVKEGDAVLEGAPLLALRAADVEHAGEEVAASVDLDHVRRDLAEVQARKRRTLDVERPEAVARRRATQQRTARENVDDLCDPGTFVEYGALALAAQRARRSLEELIEKTPGDGMVTGVGRINGAAFPEPQSRAVVIAYDYTVLAGTQGTRNHAKTDRMIGVAQSARMPVVGGQATRRRAAIPAASRPSAASPS
jgi:acetyl/propionyl-CoA carboxylase alpha subunit